MALIDPKTGLPINSRMQNQPATVTLAEMLDFLPPFPPEMLEVLASKAVSALVSTQQHHAGGLPENEAVIASMRVPVSIELGVFCGLLRDALFLRALSAEAKPEIVS